MALPAIIGGASIISWLTRVGSILLSVLCIAMPIWLSFKITKALLILLGEKALPILQSTLPAHVTTSFATLVSKIDLSLVNALIPLVEMTAIIAFAFQLYVGVIGVKAVMSIGGPLLKLQSIGQNYISWCAKVAALGKS